MSTSAARAADTAASLGFSDLLSDDGTHLRAWTNDPEGVIDGPTVVLCNGLGTNPYAWPALLDPDCGVRVVSWNHRGTGGSDRPADPSHVEIQHFVQDALSVMDHFGIDQAVLMGWSMGVNTMFELAVHHPERVKGLFAVAGVPGDTFATMLGPMFVPRFVARTLTVGLSTVLKYAGKAISPVSTRLPVGPRTIAVISHSGFMFPVADRELAVRGGHGVPDHARRLVLPPRAEHVQARPCLAEQGARAGAVRRRLLRRARRHPRHGLRGQAPRAG